MAGVQRAHVRQAPGEASAGAATWQLGWQLVVDRAGGVGLGNSLHGAGVAGGPAHSLPKRGSGARFQGHCPHQAAKSCLACLPPHAATMGEGCKKGRPMPGFLSSAAWQHGSCFGPLFLAVFTAVTPLHLKGLAAWQLQGRLLCYTPHNS